MVPRLTMGGTMSASLVADNLLRPFQLDVGRDGDFQAVLTYQGPAAYVYLADRSTCAAAKTPCDWTRPPRYAEDVLPVWRQHELSYAGRAASDPHLRSAEIVASCSVAARDGAIGHVDDFVVDGERWTITGLVVATSLWSGGKRVVVPPQAVERIDWPYHVVHLGLARDAVRRLPSLERPG